MTNKFRKERYIQQVHSSRTGKWSFRVRVNGLDERFNEDDYLSSSMAFKKAVEFRNNALTNPMIEGIVKSSNTVDDVWESVKVLFPRSDETYRKLDCSYSLYIKKKNIPIKNIKIEDIQIDLNNMIDKCSDDSISRVRSIWIKIFDVAIIKKYVSTNLAKLVEVPKSRKIKSQKRNEEITIESINELSEYLAKHLRNSHEKKYAKAILNVLYYTGMRPSEMFALEKADIDLKKNKITINKRVNSSRDVLMVGTTKTDESNRVIPFSTKIKPFLEELVKSESNLLFPNENGEYYLPCALSDKYHKLAAQIGIDFHMYQCRHTFITNLYQAGVDIKTIQDLVGQKIDATTLGYVISSDKRMENAIKFI